MLDRLRLWLVDRLLPPSVLRASSAEVGPFVSAVLSGGQFSSSGPAASTPELLEAYNRMPWLRAVVHKVAHASASANWRVFFVRNAPGKAVKVTRLQYGSLETRRRLMKQVGDGLELVELDQHPILDLLNGGSAVFPGSTGALLVHTYLDLVGEAFELKQRSDSLTNPKTRRGVVRELIPIPPNWVRALPTKSSPFYEIQFGNSGTVDKVAKEDVIFYRDPNPRNPFGRGSGTARAVGDELETSEAAARTIRARLENNAIPPFVAMPDDVSMGAPTAEQLARLKQDWQSKLRGPDKGGLVHFLRTKFKFEKLGNTFEELSLIPLLQNQRDTIIQVYGIPPEILGILSSSNRATIEAAEVLFTRHVVVPRLEFRRAVLQQTLVPEFDDRLILDFESPVPDDKEFELQVMRSQPWAFKANEIRERGGEQPIGDDGEVFAVPTNVFLQTSLRGGDQTPGAGSADGEFRTVQRQVEPQIAQEFLRRVSETLRPEDFDRVVEQFREEIEAAGQATLRELGVEISFDVKDPIALQFIANESATQIKGINETTIRALRSSLAEGFDQGEDINSLARRVRSVFSEAKGKRSVTIARTESVRAQNAGQVIASKQAGFKGKQWLSTRDPKVREAHAVGTGLDGQIQPIDGNFVDPDGATGPWPGAMSTAASSVNCRCTTISVPDAPGAEEVGSTAGREFESNSAGFGSDDAQKWGAKHYKKWFESLDKDEVKWVGEYTGGLYHSINGLLRFAAKPGDEDIETVKAAINSISKALSRAKVPDDVIAWRGVAGGKEIASELLGVSKLEDAVGKTILDNGFVSTSLEKRVAAKFAGAFRGSTDSVVFKIRIPKGSRGAFVSPDAKFFGDDIDMLGIGFKSESELLLRRNSKFVIRDVKKDQKITVTDPRNGEPRTLDVNIVELDLVDQPKVSDLKSAGDLVLKRKGPKRNRADKFNWAPGDLVVVDEKPKSTLDRSKVMWPANLDTEEKRVQFWKAAERRRAPIERRLRRAFVKVFSEQERKVLRLLSDLL